MVNNKIHEDLKRAKAWINAEEDHDFESSIGFEYWGQWVTDPFMDETYRFEVDPIEYYGKKNIRKFLKLAKVVGVI